MKCPSCSETLVMSERSGVEIDYCPNCRGVWLDRGELDKIIEKSSSPSSSSPSSQSSKGYDQYQGQPRKKRESFLGDLFDF